MVECRDDLVLTCGASHGLQLILNSFIEPDGVIFVEEVTYMIAIAVFREFSGMKIVSGACTVDWRTCCVSPFWCCFCLD